jgi:hypothetical protein
VELGDLAVFYGLMYLNSNKTGKNRKKPVETEEMPLTKRVERLKVNGGTVLRTRMNIDDYASESGAALSEFQAGQASGPRNYF